MPAQPIGVWGIDLGQCGLKAIRLQEIDGQIVATAFDYVEHPKILSQPDADPDQLTREALDKFLSRNNLRGDLVAISVPGQSGLARFVKLPPVEEKKIADIVRFEAKQQIPFNLEEVVWDYQKIGSGIVTDGFAMETEIGLFAMKRDMVSRYLQHFKDVNVDVHIVQMAPLALCNYVSFDLLGKGVTPEGEGGGGSDKRCVVALDIGADSSNLVITDGERIIWQRPIPLGGNHFTRALTKDLKLTFAKAEHLKRNATKSPDLKKILAALRPVLNDFVGEVQRSLGYFTNTHRDAHIEYMMGLGNAFRLPGLQKFLSEKLQLEVKKLNKMERIDGDQVVAQQAFTENVLTFGVAYGLALQGLKRARLLTNLLPHEIRVERLVKAKKPFAVAAAAALLFAGLGLALSYGLEYRTYGNKRVVDSVEAAKTKTKEAQTARSAFEAAKKKFKDEEDAMKTIVAGQFERDNWPELLKFVSAAIPQPDGSPRKFDVLAEDGSVAERITIDNIPKAAQAQYWDDNAIKAYQEHLRVHLASEASKEEANGKKNSESKSLPFLVQFNIESVQSLFCDNLSTYWDAVKRSERLAKIGKAWVRPTEQFGKNPEGQGWVIEVHGWTYHQHQDNFVKNTLLENIARLGIQDYKGEAADTAAPAGTAGGAAPAAAPAAQPATGAADQKKEPLGPVINRISHVVLLDAKSDSTAGSPFELLDSVHGTVQSLVFAGAAGSGPGAGMMGGGAGMMGAGAGMKGGMGGGGADGAAATAPTGNSRSSWAPLGGQTSTAAGGGGMMGMRVGAGAGKPGAPMGAGGVAPPSPYGDAKGKQMGGPMGGAGGPAAMKRNMAMTRNTTISVPADETGLKRTEFVILFIWKEPTDSDRLRNLTEAAAGAAGAGDATPGFGRPKAKPKTPPSDQKEAPKDQKVGPKDQKEQKDAKKDEKEAR
jgi:type IV pilus assembly protein PilM